MPGQDGNLAYDEDQPFVGFNSGDLNSGDFNGVFGNPLSFHSEEFMNSDGSSPNHPSSPIPSGLSYGATSGSPSVAFPIPDTSPLSGNSSGDSLSDSSSSKQAQSRTSSKSTLSGVDGTIDNGSEQKVPDWNFEEYVHMDRMALPANVMASIEHPPSLNDGLQMPSTMAGLSEHCGPFDSTSSIPNQNMGYNPETGPDTLSYMFGGAERPGVFNSSQGNSPDAQSPGSFSFHGLAVPQLTPSELNMGPWQPNAVFPAQLSVTSAPSHIMAPQYPPTYVEGVFHLTVGRGPWKSRVETQIPIQIVLSPLPTGATNLHLPRHTISKPKLIEKAYTGLAVGTLELHTSLVCLSAMQDENVKKGALERARLAALSESPEQTQPAAHSDAISASSQNVRGENELKPQDGGEVRICSNCIQRERKRASRKKSKKVEEENAWLKDELRRVVVFNTFEIKDWAPAPTGNGKMVELPMRIACYCRHHAEKMGYAVIFTITDWNRHFIAQTISPAIMITDDHKTNTTAYSSSNTLDHMLQPNALANSPSPKHIQDSALSPGIFGQDQGQTRKRPMSDNVGVPGTPTHQTTSRVPTPQSYTMSPGASSLEHGHSNKKRKSSNTGKASVNLAMTRIDTVQPGPHSSKSTSMGASPSSVNSPLASSLNFLGPTAEQPPFSPNARNASAGPFGHAPPQPGINDQHNIGNGTNVPPLDDPNMGMFSRPASAHQSRAPSPSALSMSGLQQANQPAQGTADNLPAIFKIVPAEGPKSGGIEVTILGRGFHPGMEVMFGDHQAPTTTFWGSTSLVCLVPPASKAGIVNVMAKSQAGVISPYPKLFKYVDDDEQQLVRTALTILSNKMNGGYEDVGHIARCIIRDAGKESWDARSGGESSGGTGGAEFGNLTANMSFELQLLKLLELVDLDDSPHKPKLNLRRSSTGQSMLHLACSLGHHRLVAGLLARGAHVDLRDNGGYTPLHIAALNNHPEIVRRLIANGADPTIRTLSGLTPGDVAQSQEVLRALRRVERHVRSRSSGSLHSRASSTTSLKSLWEPVSRMPTREPSSNGLGSDEESLEYSAILSSDGGEGGSDGEEQWLDVRRGNTRDMTPPTGSPDRLEQPGVDAVGGIGSPTAAMTQFKEQVTAQLHQLQQTMALHLQSLPQFRQFPQFPYALPNYQAAVLQHLAAMMPKIGGGGPRPELAGDQQPAADGKGWWDLSSLVAGPAPGSAPPPAYEEIFPQERGQAPEKKRVSPIEVKADAVCTALFDSQDAECSSSSSSLSATNDEDVVASQSLPAVLQIGRKNAITKEQQENLRRVHAERLKPFSRDRNLFFIWIPLLTIAVCAWLYTYNWVPGLLLAKDAYNAQQIQQRPLGPIYDQAPQGRVGGEV
ncbi:hypothetical protein B0H67DRAFT_649361 [Lasiosphaeris hirsuta]|uniref:IPT/TIG domain-containing protein n=1 Tax=Lasiosphaeris hirsuta TaxID=260670 RepID=A0AA39ZWK0_9PEZI|nr:hypothetical protein B0H67DRAFT_649361 [Lasiosphaeris hirsuta]